MRLTCTPKPHLPQCDFSLCEKCQHFVAKQHTKSRPNKKDRLALNAAQEKALQAKLLEINDRVCENFIFEVRRGTKSVEDERETALAAVAAGDVSVISTQDFLDFTGSAKAWAREIYDMMDVLEKSGVEEINRFTEKQAAEKSRGRFGVKQ